MENIYGKNMGKPWKNYGYIYIYMEENKNMWENYGK